MLEWTKWLNLLVVKIGAMRQIRIVVLVFVFCRVGVLRIVHNHRTLLRLNQVPVEWWRRRWRRWRHVVFRFTLFAADSWRRDNGTRVAAPLKLVQPLDGPPVLRPTDACVARAVLPPEARLAFDCLSVLSHVLAAHDTRVDGLHGSCGDVGYFTRFL